MKGGRRDQQAGPTSDCLSTSTSTSWPWTAAQERGHGARQLQEPPAPPQPQTMRTAARSWTRRLRAAHLELAHGPAHRRERREGLPDRDTLNTTPSRASSPSPKARVGVERARPCHLRRLVGALAGAPTRYKRRLFHSIKAPHAMTRCRAAKSRPSTPSPRQRLGAAGRGSRGPDRHPDDGAPLHLRRTT